MTEPRRATPEQWQRVRELVNSDPGGDLAACLLELLDRCQAMHRAAFYDRADLLRLSNAIAKIHPDRNQFLAELMFDEDDMEEAYGIVCRQNRLDSSARFTVSSSTEEPR